MMNKIMSPGKKIKALRKKYEIKQSELARNGLKRTTLSMIETEANNLIPKTGALIIKNINEILEERGINEQINIEYLMASIENQIEQKLLEFIKNINHHIDVGSEVFEKLNYYKYQLKSPETVFDMSKRIGDIYYRQEKYLEALMSYTPIFDVLLDIKKQKDCRLIFSAVFNCLLCYSYLRKYKESLGFFKLLEKIRGYFNKTEAFLLIKLELMTRMHLKDYAECLKKIEELKPNLHLDTMEEIELIIIESECHFELKNYYYAKEALYYIKEIGDEKLILFTKLRESLILSKTDNLIALQKEIEDISKDMSLLEDKDIFKKELYYDYAICLLRLDKVKLAEEYLFKCIDIYNEKFYLAVKLLIDIYKKSKKKDNLIILSSKISAIIKLKYIDNNDDLVFDIIYTYSLFNMSKEISEFIEEIQQPKPLFHQT